MNILAILLTIVDPKIKGYDVDSGGGEPGATSGLGLADEKQGLSILGSIFLPLLLLSLLSPPLLLRDSPPSSHRVEAIAKKRGISMAQVAVAWSLAYVPFPSLPRLTSLSFAF